MEGEDASAAVERWLRDSGTPLELRTASIFRRGGAIDVQHARYYIDVVSEELRETDVVATFMARAGGVWGNRPWFTLRFVVECKRAGRPWVAFLGGDVLARRGTEQLLTFERREFGPPVQVETVYDAPLIASLEPHAYQLVDTGERQEAYGAVRQVMSAARGIARDVAAPQQEEQGSVVYVVPTIVTGAPLFTCRSGSDGEPQIEEVERVLLISRLVADDALRSVWIVRDHAVEAFAADAQASADNLARARLVGRG
jgi:hypothetical protein